MLKILVKREIAVKSVWKRACFLLAGRKSTSQGLLLAGNFDPNNCEGKRKKKGASRCELI